MSHITIAVEDRGPGVPDEERDLVFERFARGGGAGRRTGSDGAGLGLSLVDEHVRMHGGRVWVEDRLDGEPGARFVIELMATELDRLMRRVPTPSPRRPRAAVVAGRAASARTAPTRPPRGAAATSAAAPPAAGRRREPDLPDHRAEATSGSCARSPRDVPSREDVLESLLAGRNATEQLDTAIPDDLELLGAAVAGQS